jgi:DNA-directed RNA polymerase specialized sigma24 family protein
MSAAPQLPLFSVAASLAHQKGACRWRDGGAAKVAAEWREEEAAEAAAPNLAFYRKHTESVLRRYLYASMQVGRTPAMLGDPVSRGWASSRKVRTFEDALIFVLDVERCLAKLDAMQRMVLSRVILQEYTQAEVAAMMHMAPRTVGYKLCHALDRLTEKLLESKLLIIPE